MATVLFSDNEPGEAFWKRIGWKERADLKVLQRATPTRKPGIKSTRGIEVSSMELADQTLAAAVIAETTNCLNSCVSKIKHCLGQLTDEQVWWRPQEPMNSIGNLVLHLCGNVRQWIVAGIGGAPDVRDRPREFSERRVIPRSELSRQLDEVVAAAAEALARMTPEEMLRVRCIQGFSVTGLGAIFDSVPHLKGHTQEIICLTRMQLGDGYKFDWVPKTTEEGASMTP